MVQISDTHRGTLSARYAVLDRVRAVLAMGLPVLGEQDACVRLLDYQNLP